MSLEEHLVGAGLVELARKIKVIPKEAAMADYEKLRTVSCNKIQPSSLVGNKAMDYFFFAKRLATKSKKGISFEEFMKSSTLRNKPYNKKLYKYNLDSGGTPTAAWYDVFRMYYGSINAFKPIIAKELYCRYKPKTILDFSAGWGGRCLGAMASDINYVGFDTNTDLRSAYEGMIKMYPHNSDIKINFMDSAKADFSKYTYDMVFTSPPYFMETKPTEEYANMPQYKSREEFNEKFLHPVLRNAWSNLSSGGVMCLNVPKDMYPDCKTVLGKATTKHPLFIQNRYGGQKRRYSEFIYVWRKGGAGGNGISGGNFHTLEGSGLPPPKWSNPLLELRQSKIPNAGKGVFAVEDIPKGTKLDDYKGEEMDESAYIKKYKDDKKKYYYSMRNIHKMIDGRKYIDENISHYINEWKTANVELRDRGLYTTKKIKKGSELYLKYPRDYNRDY